MIQMEIGLKLMKMETVEKDNAQIRDGQGADGEYVTYNYSIGNFGWTNLDKWYNYTGAKTEILLMYPLNLIKIIVQYIYHTMVSQQL